MSDSQSEDTMIAALLRERKGYVLRGLDDRVAQVDEQLKLRGHEVTNAKESETKGADGDPSGDKGADDASQTPPKNTKTRAGQQQTREGS